MQLSIAPMIFTFFTIFSSCSALILEITSVNNPYFPVRKFWGFLLHKLYISWSCWITLNHMSDPHANPSGMARMSHLVTLLTESCDTWISFLVKTQVYITCKTWLLPRARTTEAISCITAEKLLNIWMRYNVTWTIICSWQWTCWTASLSMINYEHPVVWSMQLV